ncbi:MAG: BlaI/MecI/CopY family transcriptional regulator [Nannocystaceae bacterium]
MPKNAQIRPTQAEIEILTVLWKRGPSTVRQVHEALAFRKTGYTTVLKLMQIMARKDLVSRDQSQRSHVYRAEVGREDIQTSLVGDLIDRAFAGSASQLVMRALATKPTSLDELDALRNMLGDMIAKRDGKHGKHGKHDEPEQGEKS